MFGEKVEEPYLVVVENEGKELGGVIHHYTCGIYLECEGYTDGLVDVLDLNDDLRLHFLADERLPMVTRKPKALVN